MSGLTSSTAYDVLVGAHVVVAVVGFGAVALSGVYGAAARRRHPSDSLEELRRFFEPSGRLELLILGVPFLGLAALAVAPGREQIGALWVALGAILWLVAAGLLLVVVRPGEAAIRALVSSTTAAPVPTGPVGDAAARPLIVEGARLRWSAAACDLIFVVALVVMVLKPGA